MNLHCRYIALILCGLLGACGSTDMKESLGLNRKAPDEFQVYARPPLSVPPEFALRPPSQAGEYTSGLSAETQAHSKILGTAAVPAASPLVNSPLVNESAASAVSAAVPVVSATNLPTTADSQFLANAGAGKADPRIRQEIHDEMDAPVAPKDTTYLLGGNKVTDSEVDATKEADRLKQDKANNQPPTTGETPVVAPENKGLLGNIF